MGFFFVAATPPVGAKQLCWEELGSSSWAEPSRARLPGAQEQDHPHGEGRAPSQASGGGVGETPQAKVGIPVLAPHPFNKASSDPPFLACCVPWRSHRTSLVPRSSANKCGLQYQTTQPCHLRSAASWKAGHSPRPPGVGLGYRSPPPRPREPSASFPEQRARSSLWRLTFG